MLDPLHNVDRVVRRIETYAYSYQILQKTPASTEIKLIFDDYQDSTENKVEEIDKLRGASESSLSLQPTMCLNTKKIEKTDKLRGADLYKQPPDLAGDPSID